MVGPERVVCRRDQLIDGGLAIRFFVHRHGRFLPGVAVAFDGHVYAYVNRCPHRWTELDWQPGHVFGNSGQFLICATHGAEFDPVTGICVAGPCVGGHLQPIAVYVEEGCVVLRDDCLAPFGMAGQ